MSRSVNFSTFLTNSLMFSISNKNVQCKVIFLRKSFILDGNRPATICDGCMHLDMNKLIFHLVLPNQTNVSFKQFKLLQWQNYSILFVLSFVRSFVVRLTRYQEFFTKTCLSIFLRTFSPTKGQIRYFEAYFFSFPAVVAVVVLFFIYSFFLSFQRQIPTISYVNGIYFLLFCDIISSCIK